MVDCVHRITPTLKSIVTLETVFRCKNCDEYVELRKPWRNIRALVNAFCLFAVLYAAFSKLQGTLSALGWMLAAMSAAILFFFLANYLILSLAPWNKVRDELNPELLSLYEEAGPLNEDEDVEEDVLPEELRHRRLQSYAREQDRRFRQSESFEDAERSARQMQAEMAEEVKRVRKLWEEAPAADDAEGRQDR